MVEIKLDLCEEMATSSNDCFVSVRVGDYQKLSRLAASRTYRFPQAGDRHYGKIEVFKRIGATAINIDPLSDDLRKVTIPCSDDGMGSLGFKVAVDADDKTKRKLRQEKAEDEAGTKAVAAKEYLSKHCLEVRLSEAMQALLRERPENPTEFLAQKLLSSKDVGGVLLPSPKSEKPPAPQKMDQSFKSAPMHSRFAKYQEHAPKWSPSKGPYQSISPDAFLRLHGKFKGFKVAQENMANAKPPMPTAPKFQFNASVGTWLQKKQKKAVKALPPAVEEEKPKEVKKIWAQAPSVGTWLAKPKPVVTTTEEVRSYQFRPSVGSWLMVAPPEEEEPKKAPKMIMSNGVLMGPMWYGVGGIRLV